MQQSTDDRQALQLQPHDVLNEILRDGARQMLATAIENEVGEYIAAHGDQRDKPVTCAALDPLGGRPSETEIPGRKREIGGRNGAFGGGVSPSV